MEKLSLFSLLPLAVGIVVLGKTQPVEASGFALIEQSVPGLGNSFAGGSATASDASTIFFNPAGLTRFQGNSVSGAAFTIFPAARFSKETAVTVLGTPLLGGNGGDGGVDAIVPATFASWSVSDRLKLGLGINAPFGLATQYPVDWVGRYQAVESRLSTININPSVAYRVTDQFSVGAGLNIQEVSAVLSSAIDFGLIARQAGFPTHPQSADGFLKIRGSDWSLGYNLGLMYEPTKTTRFGLSYRSPITHTLRGTGDFTVPLVVSRITTTGRFLDSRAATELKLPGTFSLGAYHELSPRIALLANVDWTNWSRFEELRVRFSNPLQPDVVQRESWRDTFRLGLGVNYNASDTLTLRAGFAFDKTPVKDEFRTFRLPDGDRFWLSIGASYQLSKNLRFDIGYAHLFVNELPFSQGSPTEGFIIGTFNNNVNILGVQMTLVF